MNSTLGLPPRTRGRIANSPESTPSAQPPHRRVVVGGRGDVIKTALGFLAAAGVVALVASRSRASSNEVSGTTSGAFMGGPANLAPVELDTSTPDEIAQTPWWSPDDFRRLAGVALSLRMDPEDLLKVLASESGLNPHATNNSGGPKTAVGLNQLTPITNSIVGITELERQQIPLMPVAWQLEYMRRYFAGLPYTKRGGAYPNAGVIYTANFAPNKLLGGISPDRVLYTHGVDGAAYDLNKSLDFGQKGSITMGDMTTQAERVTNHKLYQTAVSRLRKALAQQPLVA